MEGLLEEGKDLSLEKKCDIIRQEVVEVDSAVERTFPASTSCPDRS
jgi:hypothetical protein